MSEVRDAAGRTYRFENIRLRMDEGLIKQAAEEVVDQTRARGQLLFDRYCALHLSRYGRNFEPLHFSNGRLLPRFASLYANSAPVIRITVELRAGQLFDRFVGQPPDFIEQAFRQDPRAWATSGEVLAKTE